MNSARSKDRCCLCRRKLTDGISLLRGYGAMFMRAAKGEPASR
jgi:hypothetical protein